MMAFVKSKRGKAVAGILLFAVVIRLIYFFSLQGARFDALPHVFTNSDMHANVQWAIGIAQGDWLGHDPYHPYNDWMKKIAPLETWYDWWGGKRIFQQAPLYPYLLAAVFSVLGISVSLVLLLQLLLGVVQVALIYAIANRLFGSFVAVIAAALVAAYGPFIFFQGVLLRDTLLTTLELASVFGFLRLRRSREGLDAVFTGLCIGLAVLCKPTAIFLCFGFALWILLEKRGRIDFRIGLAATICGSMFFALLPLIARNISVGVPALSLSNRAAEALIIANAKGGHAMVLKVPEMLGPIMQKTGGDPSKVLFEVLGTWSGDYGGFLLLQFEKIRALFSPIEIENNANYYYGTVISPLLYLCFTFSVVLPFAVLGLSRRRERAKADTTLLMTIALLLPGLLLSTPLARYRLTFVALLCVAAAVGIRSLYKHFRETDFSYCTQAVLLLVAVVTIQQTVFDPRSDPLVHAQVVRPNEYFLLATVHQRSGDFAAATRQMNLAEQQAHLRPDVARIKQSVWRKRADISLEWALRAATQNDGSIVRLKLAEAERDLDRLQADGSSVYRVGAMYLALGEIDKGVAMITRHLDAYPDSQHRKQAKELLAQYAPEKQVDYVAPDANGAGEDLEAASE